MILDIVDRMFVMIDSVSEPRKSGFRDIPTYNYSSW